MRITALEIKGHALRKRLRGYDVKEVEELRDAASEALGEAAKEIMDLKEKLEDAGERIHAYASNENVLREAITTVQRMAEEMKANARKEAEILLAEARLQADEIIRQAQSRSSALQDEIFRLRKQRKELESSIKSVIDYHSSILLLEEEEARKADEESDKLRFLPK